MKGVIMTVSESPHRDVNGRFQPGRSGNPSGKKPGTRNRATLLREALKDGEDVAAARIIIDKALAGNSVAARFVIGLLIPRARDRAIELDLPEGAGARELVAAANATVQAMAKGEITPEEALTVTRVLDFRLKAVTAGRELSPPHRKQPSPPALPEPSPVYGRGGFLRKGRGEFLREEQRNFPHDLLHSTCISSRSGWRGLLAA
jgi:hypothetical protein